MAKQNIKNLLNKYLGGSKNLIRNENTELFADLNDLLIDANLDFLQKHKSDLEKLFKRAFQINPIEFKMEWEVLRISFFLVENQYSPFYKDLAAVLSQFYILTKLLDEKKKLENANLLLRNALKEMSEKIAHKENNIKQLNEYIELKNIKIDGLNEEILKIKEQYNLEIIEKDNEINILTDLKEKLENVIYENNAKYNNSLKNKDEIILEKDNEIKKLKNLINKIKDSYTNLKNDNEIKNKLLRDCEEKQSRVDINDTLYENNSIEILNLDNVVTLYDESLRYYEDGKFLKISIYIQDANNKNIDNVEGLHKYHFYNCRTIQEMKSQERSFRYCVSTRSDNYFKYKIYNNNKLVKYIEEQELYVCKNCLSIYNKQYKNINKIKIEDPTEFNEKHLLENYIQNDLLKLDNDELLLLPSEFIYDYEQIPNVYSENWPTISKVVKDTNNHTCEECQWQPKSSEENKYLHVHHINFKKFDNKLTNLKVLCIDCHSNQPNHKHIKKSTDWKNFQKLK